MSDDLVRLTVNTETCIGSGHCEMFESDVFYIDDDTGIAAVLGEGRLPQDRAEMIIEGCPSGAISISASSDTTDT